MENKYWYRNAGRRTHYHIARPDWIESGKAICGARIERPAYSATPRETNVILFRFCTHCKKGMVK